MMRVNTIVGSHHQHLNHQGKENMRIERKNGFIHISDIIGNYFVERKYLYYTEKQAIEQFKREYKKEQD